MNSKNKMGYILALYMGATVEAEYCVIDEKNPKNKILNHVFLNFRYADERLPIWRIYLSSSHLEFCTRWDWIMPVVQKLKEDGIEFEEKVQDLNIEQIFIKCYLKLKHEKKEWVEKREILFI